MQNALKQSFPAKSTRLHPRNKHGGRYDFAELIKCCPELGIFVTPNAYGDDSIDFADPDSVRTLNRALLKQFYGVAYWNIPAGYLCPPIPGRADYVHYLADLLASGGHGDIPHGNAIRVLDIGVGANLIYPLIGHSEYRWHFVGSEIDREALASAQAILDGNAGLGESIELRLQPSRADVFKGILRADEHFDLVMCNPPFHSSGAEARAGSARKWQNLGKTSSTGQGTTLNFGGHGTELHCAGGEVGFIGRMIEESTKIPHRCLWFTSLVSKAASLPEIYRALKAAGVLNCQTVEMAQGQKKSRMVAWTFLSQHQQQLWHKARCEGTPSRRKHP